MTTPHSERRRFQFGLRKLLLWTAVVAVYLGIVKWADLGILFAVLLAVLVCLIGVGGSIAKNPNKTRWWHLRPGSPIIVGALVGGTLALLFGPALVNDPDPPWWLLPWGQILLGVVGGVIVGLLLELAFPTERRP